MSRAKLPPPLRILLTADPGLVVPPLHYGGIERIIDQLAVELRRRGHDVSLLATAGSGCAIDRVLAWPQTRALSRLKILRHAAALRRAVTRTDAQVIHSFSRLAYLLPMLRSRRAKIMSYQRHPTSRTVRLADRLSGGSILFTGCSQFIARLGAAHGGDWRAIPNFVDPARFRFRGSVAPTAPLVFLSRIESIKGAHTAIAVARAAGRRLILAGNHAASGAEADYWREQIAPQIDGTQVSYIGPVDDRQKVNLLGHAAALLVPVEWEEPFGIVFIEALACGTPVVSCPRGALPEIVRDGREGFLAEDEAGLVRAVREIGAIDRRACRRRVEHHFSASVVTDAYEALYRLLCLRTAAS